MGAATNDIRVVKNEQFYPSSVPFAVDRTTPVHSEQPSS
jgi:hypothetical protein